MSDTTSTGGLKDSAVVFKTAQGGDCAGTLLKLTRFSVAFELYNPATVLRTSEVLEDCKVIVAGRTLYSGKAVVRSLINTGSAAVVCEATLSENSWTDVQLTATNGQLSKKISTEYEGFMREWQKLYRVVPEYKVVLGDMQSFLADLRLWLNQVELGLHSLSAPVQAIEEREKLEQLRADIVPVINGLFDRFEAVAATIDEDLRPVHMTFGKRLLHPLLLSSPFVNRTFTKPLGYAGDYEMVNMMFRDPYEGGSLFAKMINAYALQLPPIIAHRNRINYLCNRLTEEAVRLSQLGRPLRVFNLGCGPAHEVQKFLAQGVSCNHTRFVLADFNDKTLLDTGSLLRDMSDRHRVNIEMVKKTVHQLIKQSERGIPEAEKGQYDLVYCAGLFDYLSDKVCERLMNVFYEMLAPAGLLVVTNVDVHPSQNEMEYFLEWFLIHRDTERMLAIAPARARRDQLRLLRDATGVNIFLEVRKDKGEK